MRFVKDSNELHKIQEISNRFIGWNYNPAHDAQIYYFDWHAFTDISFINLLNQLSHANGDTAIWFEDLMITQSTKELEIYYRAFGRFPLIRYDTPIDNADYFKALSEKVKIENFYPADTHPMDAPEDRYYVVGYTSDYIVFPTSGDWHIYGESDLEIARLEIAPHLLLDTSKIEIKFFDAREVKMKIKSIIDLGVVD